MLRRHAGATVAGMRVKHKLRLAFLTIGLVPLAATGLAGYWLSARALVSQVQNQLESLATTHKHRLENVLAFNRERLLLVASRTQLRLSLKAWTEVPSPHPARVMTTILLDAQRTIPAFERLSVLSFAGRVVASTDPDAVDADWSALPSFVLGRQTISADNLVRDSQRRLRLQLAAPLQLDGQALGVLLIDAVPDELLELLRDYTGLGITGEALLARLEPDGSAQLLAPTRFDASAALRRRVLAREKTDPLVQSALAGPGFHADTEDYRGQRILAVTRRIEPTGWVLQVKIDRAEALHLVSALRLFATVVGVGTLLVVTLIGLLLARSITRPVGELTEAATRLSAGDLTRRVAVRGRDELGVLAASFNQMAESLAKTNLALEAKVGERTVALEDEIAERRRAEEQLRAKSVALEQSNAELEQFAYAASHDLQEPLRTVNGFLALLRDEYGERLDERGRGFIRQATDGATRLQRLINGLLNYAKVGRRHEPVTAVDTGRICAVALEHLATAVRETGATIEVQPLPRVLGDELLLGQLFQNLIGNALKFHGAAPPQVVISAHRLDGHWEFAVRDNGIGIPAEHQARVFELFQRLNPPEKFAGSGIGLATCRKIVERHGGRIWVESPAGPGTVFRFTLPATP